MVIFSWIVLGLSGLMLLGSGLAWACFLGLDDSDWRRLGVRLFRWAVALVLFYVNVLIYQHIVRGLFAG